MAAEQPEEPSDADNMLAILRGIAGQPDALKKNGDRVTIAFNQLGETNLREVRQDIEFGDVKIPVFLALDEKNAAHSLSLECASIANASDQTLKSAAGMMVMGVHGDAKTRRELRDEINTTLQSARNMCKPS